MSLTNTPRLGDRRPLFQSILDFVFVAAPKAAGGALLLGSNIVLLRALGPDAFGLYAFCVSFILLADSVFGGTFDLAVIRLGRPRDGSSLPVEQAALRLKMAGMALLAAGLIAVASFANAGVFGGANRSLVLASGFALATGLLLRSVLVHLQIRHAFRTYGAIDLLQLAVKFGGIGVAVAFLTPPVDLLLLLLGVGPLLAAALGASRWCPGLFGIRPVESAVYRVLSATVGWYLATIALGALIGRLDVILLGGLGSIEQVGLFAAGQAFAVIPELLGTYVAVLVTPRIIPAVREGQLRGLYRRLQVSLSVLAAVIALVALALWSDLASLVLPSRYTTSAAITFILLPASLAAMITMPLALPTVMFWRKRLLFQFDCLLLPVLLILYAKVIPAFGEIGAAWVSCAASLTRSAMVQAWAWWCTHREQGLSVEAADTPPASPPRA